MRRIKFNRTCLMISVLAVMAFQPAARAGAADPWVVYEGQSGPGKGKQIVLISGDEEYRSEEGLPQLGKILALRHGFKCTVLFAIDPKDGAIHPEYGTNIPGLKALRTADLVIMLMRYRDLPDDQMAEFAAYLDAGKPLIGLRTATHAFKIPADKPYARFSCDSKVPGWEGGFGRRILGETWVSHHGAHKKESTRGIFAPGTKGDPIVSGCEEIWGSTDVYTVRLPLPDDSRPLILGQVLEGMSPGDKPLDGPKNNPLMPVAWTKTYPGAYGEAGRVFTTTMGAATDLANEGLRRLIVNAAYWCVGLEKQIPPRANVDLVGEYHPSPYGFGGQRKGVKPEEHALSIK